ncbi:MAG: hypothetical protein RIE52_09290 [Balneola sp.]|jgi:hypothetical protein
MKLISLILFTFITTGTVFSQSGGFAGASQRIGYGPEALAMSNAMTAVTTNGSNAHYNPAHSALLLTYIPLNLSVSSLSYDRIHQTFGAVFQLPPSAGVTVGLLRSGIDEIDGRTVSGYPNGSFDVSEYQLFTAFGIRLSEKLNAGFGFKLNYADYHDDLDAETSVGIDLGFLYKINNHINFGFSIQDMFAEYRWNSAELYNQNESRNVINKFPTRFKWGLAYQKEQYTVSADYEIQALSSEVTEEEIFISGGRPVLISTTSELKTNVQQFRLGGSWNVHERLTLRGGYNLPDLSNTDSWGASSGFSLYLPFDKFSPSIGYAFVLEPNRISNMHVFSLSLKL